MKSNKPKIKTDMSGQLFCTGCGKAGFKTISHGYGHTGVCRGIDEIREALGPTLPPSSPSPSPLGSSPPSSKIPGIDLAIQKMMGIAPVAVASENFHRVQIAELQEQVETLKKMTTNHVSHLSGQMNGAIDFFESPVFKWGLVAVAIVAIFYILEKGDSKTKQSVGNKILDLAIKKI